MDYQVKRFENLIRNQGQGTFWEMDLPDGYAKATFEEGSEEYSRELEKLTDLFQDGWELVMAVSHSWWDDGGQAVHLYIANKKARDRVWGKFYMDDQVFYPERFYIDDLRNCPEDYMVYVSGPY